MATPEFALLAALRPYLDGDSDVVPVGVGDDAAVVDVAGSHVAIAVDTLVDGVHVDLSLSSFEDLGWKALAVNVSDLAAMGAWPIAALVSLQLPAGLAGDDVVDLYTGLRTAADAYRCKLVGGDTVASSTLAVSVTVVGALHGTEALRRDGALVGDAVLVVGALGLAASALALHREGRHAALGEHPELSRAHRRPQALPAAGAALARAGATACIDVSDGLGRDLGHIATASGVRIDLDADRVPLHPALVNAAALLDRDPVELAVGGGDDYALAATVPRQHVDGVVAALTAAGAQAHEVGEVVAGVGAWLGGRDVTDAGWQHLSQDDT